MKKHLERRRGDGSRLLKKKASTKKGKILGVLKCIIQQERGLRSDSRGPFFYYYIGVVKKVDFFSGLGRFSCLLFGDSETGEPSPCHALSSINAINSLLNLFLSSQT